MKKLLLGIGLIGLVMSSCSKDEEAAAVEMTLAAAEVGAHQATVNFEKIEGILLYDVSIAEDGQPLKYLNSIDGEQEGTYTIDELKANTKYNVEVKATNLSDANLGKGTISFTTAAVNGALVGTWKKTYNDDYLQYTFNADGFGTHERSGFDARIIMWETMEVTENDETITKLKITSYAGEVGGTSTTEVVSYVYYGPNEAMTIDGVTYYPVN